MRGAIKKAKRSVAAAMGVSLLLTLTALLTGCSGPPDPDTYDAAAIDWFGQVNGRAGAASEAEAFTSLEEAATSADAVVIGPVVDVVTTRTVGGPEDSVPLTGYVVEPTEVIKGSLPDRDQDKLTVEMLFGPGEAAKADIPAGQYVWLLRSKAKEHERAIAEMEDAGRTPLPSDEEVAAADAPYSRLISTQGLYVQGKDHVVNPISEGAMAPQPTRDAEQYATISDLVAYLKSV